MTRTFIGTYPCAVCARRVRVYDWLPECVLCAQCAQRMARSEALAEGSETTDDNDNERTIQ